MVTGIAPWIYFNVVVLALLAVDLFVLHRRSRVVGMGEALAGSAFWISLALLFNLGIYYYAGKEPALAFFTRRIYLARVPRLAL